MEVEFEISSAQRGVELISFVEGGAMLSILAARLSLINEIHKSSSNLTIPDDNIHPGGIHNHHSEERQGRQNISLLHFLNKFVVMTKISHCFFDTK